MGKPRVDSTPESDESDETRHRRRRRARRHRQLAAKERLKLGMDHDEQEHDMERADETEEECEKGRDRERERDRRVQEECEKGCDRERERDRRVQEECEKGRDRERDRDRRVQEEVQAPEHSAGPGPQGRNAIVHEGTGEGRSPSPQALQQNGHGGSSDELEDIRHTFVRPQFNRHRQDQRNRGYHHNHNNNNNNTNYNNKRHMQGYQRNNGGQHRYRFEYRFEQGRQRKHERRDNSPPYERRRSGSRSRFEQRRQEKSFDRYQSSNGDHWRSDRKKEEGASSALQGRRSPPRARQSNTTHRQSRERNPEEWRERKRRYDEQQRRRLPPNHGRRPGRPGPGSSYKPVRYRDQHSRSRRLSREEGEYSSSRSGTPSNLSWSPGRFDTGFESGDSRRSSRRDEQRHEFYGNGVNGKRSNGSSTYNVHPGSSRQQQRYFHCQTGNVQRRRTMPSATVTSESQLQSDNQNYISPDRYHRNPSPERREDHVRVFDFDRGGREEEDWEDTDDWETDSRPPRDQPQVAIAGQSAPWNSKPRSPLNGYEVEPAEPPLEWNGGQVGPMVPSAPRIGSGTEEPVAGPSAASQGVPLLPGINLNSKQTEYVANDEEEPPGSPRRTPPGSPGGTPPGSPPATSPGSSEMCYSPHTPSGTPPGSPHAQRLRDVSPADGYTRFPPPPEEPLPPALDMEQLLSAPPAEEGEEEDDEPSEHASLFQLREFPMPPSPTPSQLDPRLASYRTVQSRRHVDRRLHERNDESPYAEALGVIFPTRSFDHYSTGDAERRQHGGESPFTPPPSKHRRKRSSPSEPHYSRFSFDLAPPESPSQSAERSPRFQAPETTTSFQATSDAQEHRHLSSSPNHSLVNPEQREHLVAARRRLPPPSPLSQLYNDIVVNPPMGGYRPEGHVRSPGSGSGREALMPPPAPRNRSESRSGDNSQPPQQRQRSSRFSGGEGTEREVRDQSALEIDHQDYVRGFRRLDDTRLTPRAPLASSAISRIPIGGDPRLHYSLLTATYTGPATASDHRQNSPLDMTMRNLEAGNQGHERSSTSSSTRRVAHNSDQNGRVREIGAVNISLTSTRQTRTSDPPPASERGGRDVSLTRPPVSRGVSTVIQNGDTSLSETDGGDAASWPRDPRFSSKSLYYCFKRKEEQGKRDGDPDHSP